MTIAAPLQRRSSAVRRLLRGRSGFTILEISLALAVLGVLAVTSIPMFLTYYNGAQLRVAAEEVAAFINQGRQIGIRENAFVCVQIGSTTMQYRVGSTNDCTGTLWVGAGSDSAGSVKTPDGVTLAATGNPIFNYLGLANPTATYTITKTSTGATLRVFVATSGRVTIGP